ncbi:hypothetical protein HZS_4607 [Henneguya salminicola]|nr:hypothetical protein HZS_4607 [Henneguya salminicola]
MLRQQSYLISGPQQYLHLEKWEYMNQVVVYYENCLNPISRSGTITVEVNKRWARRFILISLTRKGFTSTYAQAYTFANRFFV